MLESITQLGSPDPKVRQSAALDIIQHVSQNKGELEYLIKRLVKGLESSKISTRTGCYSTLAVLLSLRKVDPFQLFDFMQKALVTDKKSTKKERRLIYIARILCSGAILKTSGAAELCKEKEFLPASLKDIVDISQKKPSYFQLATPFLSHLLQDDSLTPENFESLVWPPLHLLYSSKLSTESEGVKKEDEDDETVVSSAFCCKVQLALICKNSGYKQDFDCLRDVKKIARSFLGSQLEFAEEFLKSLFKYLKTTSEIDEFWSTILENIKSTQFDLLCVCVEKAVEGKVSISSLVTKQLVKDLLSVFNKADAGFQARSRKVIDLLLKWGKPKEEGSLGKKERKSVMKALFSGEPPNLLHEYKYLHSVIRAFLTRITARDLSNLYGIITTHLEDDDLGLRMAIVYLQFLAKIAQCRNCSAETSFEIGKRLLNIGLGKEKLQIKLKTGKEDEEEEKTKENGEEEDESVEEDGQEQIKKCCSEGLKSILSSTYNFEFMDLMSSHLAENSKELTSNEDTLKILKKIKKTQKKFEDPHLKYILCAYGLRVLLDEGQVLSTSSETVKALMEIAKNTEGEEEMFSELIRFILSTVLKEPHPAFSYEAMFNKLIIEGKVKEEAIQAFADSIDVQLSPEDEEDDEDEESEEDDSDDEQMDVDGEEAKEQKQNGMNGKDSSDEGEEEEDSEDDEEDEGAQPPKKKAKTLDPEAIAKLKATIGEEDSDSEESIALDEATEEDLQKMDSALAKVFAVKKTMKDEQQSEIRALMRTLRLTDIYISRHIKAMPVSALLILLMPVVNSLQNSLKLKKNTELTTKVIGVLDNLNRTKKFMGCDDVVEGTLPTLVTELYQMAQEKKNKLIRELLEHSVILLTKCFLQKSKKSKKEQKRIIELYTNAVDTAKSKIKKRKQVNRKGNAKKVVAPSRFVRLALETLPEWPEGKKAIEQRINE